MATKIIQTRPDHPDAALLIGELDEFLNDLYPTETQHGYSIEKLIAENVDFFIIYHNNIPAGCGGLKLSNTPYAEPKRMYIRPRFRRLGLAKQLLTHLENHALKNNIPTLRLETGIHQHAAIKFYQQNGFLPIPPFGEYEQNLNCTFFEKHLK